MLRYHRRMSDPVRPSNFLTDIIDADLASGRVRPPVVTRFPPEPNGFLHIGHAKSILLNFGLAERYGGRAHLRFDDTNPTTEETEYVESIEADVRWLGCDWGEHLHFASDYFERMYACAERLVREGHAYVDSQAQEAIREQRGDFKRPGVDSPFRNRPAQESLDLLRRMRRGEFPDGACVLRARIDMAHRNVLMRDPLLYRIRHAHHHRTGDAWPIYPMYDWAHPLEDAIEGVTHSICTLEFESNRELYDWVLDHTGPWDPRPRQYEFARLSLGYTVLSKRKLLQLVGEKRVSGWDDPRMPTIAGMRRRGVTPEALRDFAELIGVAKNNSVVDIGKLEFAIRGDLERRAPRAMAVLDPVPLTLAGWDPGRVDELEVPWWPAEPGRGGTRKVPLGRDLLVERDDVAVDPPAGWKRLAPGREVRLAGAIVVRCDEVVQGPGGEVREVRCSVADGGDEAGAARRGIGTIHWVHAGRSLPAEIQLYDRLFTAEQPDAEGNFLDVLNPESLRIARGARLEPALGSAAPGTHWQFLRTGYFFADPVASRPGAPVFLRTITLKDTWGARTSAASSAASAFASRPSRPAKGPAPSAAAPRAPRAEARSLDAAASAVRARLAAVPGLPPAQADRLAADPGVAGYFEAAVAAGAPAAPAARWLMNELAGLAAGRPLATLPLPPAAFGRFVALAESGRLTGAGAKSLLASLVERAGEPEARLAELGLERIEDGGAVAAAVARVLAERRAEVERFRAGEKKLMGFLLGAAMRETQGRADPAAVRNALEEALR